jgi:hypothetical protein
LSSRSRPAPLGLGLVLLRCLRAISAFSSCGKVLFSIIAQGMFYRHLSSWLKTNHSNRHRRFPLKPRQASSSGSLCLRPGHDGLVYRQRWVGNDLPYTEIGSVDSRHRHVAIDRSPHVDLPSPHGQEQESDLRPRLPQSVSHHGTHFLLWPRLLSRTLRHSPSIYGTYSVSIKITPYKPSQTLGSIPACPREAILHPSDIY